MHILNRNNGYLFLILINIAVAWFVKISFYYRFFSPAIENSLGSLSICLAVIATWAIVQVLRRIADPIGTMQMKIITIISIGLALLMFTMTVFNKYSIVFSMIAFFYDLAILSYILFKTKRNKWVTLHYLVFYYLIAAVLQYMCSLATEFGFWDYWTEFGFVTILAAIQMGLLISFVISAYKQLRVIFSSKQHQK